VGQGYRRRGRAVPAPDAQSVLRQLPLACVGMSQRNGLRRLSPLRDGADRRMDVRMWVPIVIVEST
jgi:hypothetical protein